MSNRAFWADARKARKAHVCGRCGGAINPGDVYRRTRIDSPHGDAHTRTGGAYTLKECPTCLDQQPPLFDIDDKEPTP